MGRYAELDGRRARGIAIAREVSAILRKAGYEKAGRYRMYGRRSPGFAVSESGNGAKPVPTAAVSRIGHGPIEDYKIAIEEDGRFEAVVTYGALVVTRREGR